VCFLHCVVVLVETAKCVGIRRCPLRYGGESDLGGGGVVVRENLVGKNTAGNCGIKG
jgi:hypothetical protein